MQSSEQKASKFVRMAEVLPNNDRTTKILKKREQEAEEKRRLEDQVSLLV